MLVHYCMCLSIVAMYCACSMNTCEKLVVKVLARYKRKISFVAMERLLCISDGPSDCFTTISSLHLVFDDQRWGVREIIECG